jgi:RNA 2',3'-cyclic 3'-phosphodiesterase
MDKNNFVRTFICIELPEEIQDRIDALQDRLKQVEASVSWVRSGNIHLTLKFLGDVPPSKIAGICSAVENAIQGEEVFPVEVGGTGCFPSARSPRVLWVGVGSPTEALKHLQTSIEKGLEAIGFAREPRPFSPHLTLGRVKSQRNARRLVEALTEAGFAKLSFQAEEIVVMRSDLKATGAAYTPLATILLQS